MTHRQTVAADRELCASSGNCAATAPEVFGQGDLDGIVVVLDEHPPDEAVERVELAEELCPVRAIRVTRST